MIAVRRLISTYPVDIVAQTCKSGYCWGCGAIVSDWIAQLNVRLELKLGKQMDLEREIDLFSGHVRSQEMAGAVLGAFSGK